MSNDPLAPRVLVTVHGIRTFGQWADRLSALVREQDPARVAVSYGYGYFSAIAFLIPFLRWIEVLRFRRQLKSLSDDHDGAVFDIVAHSFGTYIVGHALRSSPVADLPRIRTVILAGSVLPSRFDWSEIFATRKVARVVNECGINDDVLILSQLAVLGTGMAGRIGFQGILNGNLYNRFHAGGHDLYFNGAFMDTNWVRLLTAHGLPPHIDERSPPGVTAGAAMWTIQNFTAVKLAMYVVIPALVVNAQWHRHRTQVALQWAAEANEQLMPLATPTDRALRLALASLDTQETEAGRVALERALSRESEPTMMIAFNGEGGPVSLDDSGKLGVLAMGDVAVVVETGNWKPRSSVHLDGSVKHIGLSRDGTHVFATDDEGSVVIWRADRSGQVEPETRIQILRDILAARFSKDGKELLLVSTREREMGVTLHRIDSRTGKERQDDEFETGPATAAAIGVDGRWVVVATSDAGHFSPERHPATGAVQVWDSKTGKPVGAFPSSTGVTAVAIGIDDKMVAAGDEFGLTSVWDRSSGSLEMEAWRPQPVRAVEFSRWEPEVETPPTMTVREILADRRPEWAIVNGLSLFAHPLLASVHGDGTVSVSSLQSRREVALLAHRQPVRGIAFAPQDRSLLTVSGKTLRGWPPSTVTLATMDLESSLRAIAVGPTGKTLLAVGENGLWRAWHRSTGRLTAQMQAVDLASPKLEFGRAVFATGPKTAYFLAEDASTLGAELILFDVLSGLAERRFEPQGGLAGLAASADGQWLGIADNAGGVTLLGLRPTIGLRASLKTSATMASLGLSARGDWVVAGHSTGRVEVWRRSDGSHFEWQASAPVHLVAVTEQGRVAWADRGGDVVLAQAGQSRETFVSRGPGAPASAIALSGSDRLAWAVGGAIRVMAPTDAAGMAILASGGPVSNIVFGPEDHSLYFAIGNRMRSWTWDVQELVQRGCARLNLPDGAPADELPDLCLKKDP